MNTILRAEQKRLQEKEEKERRLNEVARRAKEQKELYKSATKKITTNKFPCLRNAEDYLSNINMTQYNLPHSA